MSPHSTAAIAKHQPLNFHPVCYVNVSLLFKWNYGILVWKRAMEKTNLRDSAAALFYPFKKVHFCVKPRTVRFIILHKDRRA